MTRSIILLTRESMPRLVDLICKVCGKEEHDKFFMILPDAFQCGECGGVCDEIWWGSRKPKYAQWSDRNAVVVFENQSTGAYRYPRQNAVPAPPGYNRIVMRSLREVETFEKQAKVTCEAMHYDSGSGTQRPDENWRGERMNH